MKSPAGIDLHLHIDGAVRMATMLDLAREENIRLPAQTVEELKEHVTVGPDCSTLTDFLATFEVFYPLLKTPRALERVTRELIEDLEKQGLIYAELRFAPILNVRNPEDKRQLLDAVKAVLAGIKTAKTLRAGLILCCYRGFAPELAESTAKIALQIKEQEGDLLAGLDLAGDESRYEARLYRPAFDLVAGHIPVTVHAAEAAGADSARSAIEELGARRIGHGVRIREDPALLDRVISEKIALEMCLTSNLQTGTVANLKVHPFHQYLKKGVAVTINTDDPAISGITLADEWTLATTTYGLSPQEQKQILLNAAEAAFTTTATKSWLKERIQAAF